MKTTRKFKIFNVFDKKVVILKMNEKYQDSDGSWLMPVKYSPKDNKLSVSINGKWVILWNDNNTKEFEIV